MLSEICGKDLKTDDGRVRYCKIGNCREIEKRLSLAKRQEVEKDVKNKHLIISKESKVKDWNEKLNKVWED